MTFLYSRFFGFQVLNLKFNYLHEKSVFFCQFKILKFVWKLCILMIFFYLIRLINWFELTRCFSSRNGLVWHEIIISDVFIRLFEYRRDSVGVRCVVRTGRGFVSESLKGERGSVRGRVSVIKCEQMSQLLGHSLRWGNHGRMATGGFQLEYHLSVLW